MLAKRDRRTNEIVIGSGLSSLLIERSQIGQKLSGRVTRKPRIVEHDQVVCAGLRSKIHQFFFEKIVVRKLGDVDMNALERFVVVSGLLERVSFNAGDNR